MDSLAELPSVHTGVHTGGELVVMHRGSPLVFEFGVGDNWAPYCSYYAAHYADVEHEVKPVTPGYRVATAYNLLLLLKGRHRDPHLSVAVQRVPPWLT